MQGVFPLSLRTSLMGAPGLANYLSTHHRDRLIVDALKRPSPRGGYLYVDTLHVDATYEHALDDDVTVHGLHHVGANGFGSEGELGV